MKRPIQVIHFALLLALMLSACGAAAATRAPSEYTGAVPSAASYEVQNAAAPAQAASESAFPPAPRNDPPVDNFFRDYGVNPFVDPLEDHLSTFALDVDTASYTVARRYLRDGLLPPAEAIRVEEFVNYFDQGYPQPEGAAAGMETDGAVYTGGAAFGIHVDGAVSPFQDDGTLLLRFGVQGYQVPDAERLPASLTFVIDVSGSMDMENRLGLVKHSLQLLVERLRPTDSVAIVVYGTEARIVLYPTSGEERQLILDAIYSLQPEGSTNAEAGLRLGYEMAYRAFRPGQINRVILCSDGVANVGATGPEEILRSIRDYADTGITLTSVGFGMGNFNDVLMEQLADQGDGMYAYVDDLDEARRLFVEDLTATLQTIALSAKIQVDFNPETVARYRLIGYENRDVADQDFRNDQVDAGELGAGHTATAMYAVQLKPGASGRVATVQLRWEDPASHAVTEINTNFNTWDLAPDFYSAAPHYQLAAVAAQYAEVLRDSPWANDRQLPYLLNTADHLARLLPADPDVAELARMLYQTGQLQGQ